VEFLEQAGCDVEIVRLADRGVHGNGHGMMLELDNAEPLAVIVDWVEGKFSQYRRKRCQTPERSAARTT
jgi:hypothetical protein